MKPKKEIDGIKVDRVTGEYLERKLDEYRENHTTGFYMRDFCDWLVKQK